MTPTAAGTPADLELLERIARQDPAAIAAFYDRHARLLFGLILRIVRDRGDAEDVLQAVFVRVWNRADTYDASLGGPLAWLLRIARNLAIDRVRARNARPQLDDSLAGRAEPADGSADPEVHARRAEQHRAIVTALARLPEEQRVVIERAFFLGESHSELASRLKVPLGTIKTRIRRGMLAMRDVLQHLESDVTE